MFCTVCWIMCVIIFPLFTRDLHENLMNNPFYFFQSISNKKGDLRYKFCSERVYCSSKQMSQLYLSRFCFFFSQKTEVLSFFFLLPWYTSRIYLPLRLCIIQTLEVKVLFIFSDEYQIYFNLVVHMKLLYYIT